MSKLLDLLAARPPGAFDGFSARFEAVEDEPGFVAARFGLACTACANNTLLVEEEGSESGALGLVGTCERCGHSASIFNATRDGYDGSFGHLDTLKGDTRLARLTDEASRPLPAVLVAAEVSYSVEAEELIALGEEDGIAVQDLFDWFHLYVSSDQGSSWHHVWEYECA